MDYMQISIQAVAILSPISGNEQLSEIHVRTVSRSAEQTGTNNILLSLRR
jgi:hypothetical protein